MNELSLESSPYLLQHAQNPVHWKAWNEQSLALAQNQQKLIFKIFLYIVSEICNDGSQRPDYFINLKIYLQFFLSISISGPLLLLL